MFAKKFISIILAMLMALSAAVTVHAADSNYNLTYYLNGTEAKHGSFDGMTAQPGETLVFKVAGAPEDATYQWYERIVYVNDAGMLTYRLDELDGETGNTLTREKTTYYADNYTVKIFIGEDTPIEHGVGVTRPYPETYADGRLVGYDDRNHITVYPGEDVTLEIGKADGLTYAWYIPKERGSFGPDDEPIEGAEDNIFIVKNVTEPVEYVGEITFPGGSEQSYFFDIFPDESAKRDLAKAEVTGIKQKTYTGKAITQDITVKYKEEVLKVGTDYTVTYKNNTNAGSAKVAIVGKGSFTGTLTKTFQIAKAKNPLTVKPKTGTVKYSKLKKKNQTLTKSAVLSVSKAKGTVTYSKSSGNKKITIDKKTGKITVKKGLKKGTYKVTVKVTAAGNSNYAKGTNSVKLKMKVK